MVQTNTIIYVHIELIDGVSIFGQWDLGSSVNIQKLSQKNSFVLYYFCLLLLVLGLNAEINVFIVEEEWIYFAVYFTGESWGKMSHTQ